MRRSYPLFVLSLTAALLSGCADVPVPAEIGSAERISEPAVVGAGFEA